LTNASERLEKGDYGKRRGKKSGYQQGNGEGSLRERIRPAGSEQRKLLDAAAGKGREENLTLGEGALPVG
jgi:hypothetical protein